MGFYKRPQKPVDEQAEISRIKLPRGAETFGVVEQRLGGSRMRVRCLDGKTRICRIPGRLKRTLWVREGDIIIVEPWELGGDGKGDVMFKYTKAQTGWLHRKGYLSMLASSSEF
ncbi:translation initiation factor eIF-1A [Candidatus Woesearchaeota archaeon]|nr:translation initiation factor eIF-1A [Candidatus Woesearchaeota archaeon]